MPRQLFIAFVVYLSYVAAALSGFRVAFLAEQVTTIWAPTGIAQAALLLCGLRLWPAVWLGAFTANALTSAALWTAPLIATGNTLEAVLATVILQRLAFDPALRRTRDGLAFIFAAASLAPAISATIGVSTLSLSSAAAPGRFVDLWWAWWLGDALGALVVGTTIMTLARTAPGGAARAALEVVALVAAAGIATHLAFGEWLGGLSAYASVEYVIFPFVIAAAVRQRQPATALAVFAAAGVAIGHTLNGSGPFAGSDIHQSLVLLQVFMAVVAVTGILLAAAITERETSDRRWAAAHAVGDVLMRSSTIDDASVRILRVLCDRLDWAAAVMWMVDHGGESLHSVATYARLVPDDSTFLQMTRETRLARGIGLPGRVWESGRAAWIQDVADDRNFPRAAAARATGVHGAFGFPIVVAGEVRGVIECFNRTVLSANAPLLETMLSVGAQIGQFVAGKEVEAAVAEGQRRTRAMLDTALDAIIGMDQHGIITDFNPAAERTFGHTAASAVGRELAELIIPPALRALHREGLRRYLATGRAVVVDTRIETMAQHADGSEFPVEVAITRIPGESPPRFTGFVRDLTARRRAERERDELLERELAARRDAEAANRAKDEFLATLSHELRTPLNAIIGWTRMLLDGSLDEDSRRRALDVIDRNAKLQAALVGDILDVSRIITGGLRLERRPVDLGTVIGAALDAVRPAAEAKRIKIHMRIGSSARLTEGDPQRLQQIVWNLLANAVKFSPIGGEVEVTLAADSGDAGLRLTVRDNGIGIEPDFLPHVFDRFRQADGSVSRQHGGLGLGLAIVRHLVELHGGRVRAESEGANRGATFIVELPRAEPPVADGAGAVAPERIDIGALAGCAVLVVDDEADTRALLVAALAAAGADVRAAESVREAIEQLDMRAADVVLADIGMPGDDGYALIREIRARDDSRDRRVPVLAVTAYAGREDRDRAILAGFDDFLAKPVDPAAVVEAVRSLRGMIRG